MKEKLRISELCFNNRLINRIITYALVISYLSFLGWVYTHIPEIPEVEIQVTKREIKAETLEETLHEAITRLSNKYNVSSVMVQKIITCESSLYEKAINENIRNGKVWSRDHGPMQINDFYHAGKMQEMGWSIYRWEDSLEYGVWLLKTEGVKHWRASAHCHGYY